MRLRSFSLLIVLTLTACAGSRPRVTPPPPPQFDGHYFRFPTGLQLAVYEDPTARRTSVTVSYGAGAIDELSGKEGLAHLVEHLTFRARPGGPGTPTRAAKLIAHGAVHNAETTFEETVFFADAPRSRLLDLLAVEASRMRDPLAHLTDEDVRVEQSVDVAELRKSAADPNALAMDQSLIFRSLLPGHPFGRGVAGTERSILGLSMQDAMGWTNEQYVPSNAVIVVTGARSAEETRAMVEKAFGVLATGGDGIPESSPMDRAPPPPPAALAHRPPLAFLQGVVESRQLWAAWTAPGRASGELAPLIASAAALQMHLAEVFESNDGVKSVSVFPVVNSSLSLIVARFELTPGADALRLADDVADHCAPDTTKKWFEKLPEAARTGLEAGAFWELEKLSGQQIAQYVRLTGRSDFAAGRREELSRNLDHIPAFLERYVTPGQMRSLLMIPQPLSAALADKGTGTALRRDAHLDRGELPPGKYDAVSLADGAPFEGLESFTTGSGLRVLALRRPRLPIVDARLVVRHRSPGDGPAAGALPSIAAKTAAFVSGASWMVGPVEEAPGAVVLRGTMLSGLLPGTLSGMYRWVTRTPYPFAAALTTFAKASEVAGWEDDIAARKEIFRMAHLFGADKPGTFEGKAIAKEIEGLSWESVRDWINVEFRPQNATLILVGDLPPTGELRAQIDQELGLWRNRIGLLELLHLVNPPPPSATLPPPPAPPGPKKRRALLFPAAGGVTELVVSLRAPVMEPSAWATSAVAAELLQERLESELRYSTGRTYAVQVLTQDVGEGSVLSVETVVRADAAKQVLDGILEEVAKLQREPPSGAELDAARWRTAVVYDAEFGTNSELASGLQWTVTHGADEGTWDAFPRRLQAVSGQDISRLMGQLTVGAEAITASGDVETIEAALKAAGTDVQRFAPTHP